MQYRSGSCSPPPMGKVLSPMGKVLLPMGKVLLPMKKWGGGPTRVIAPPLLQIVKFGQNHKLAITSQIFLKLKK